MNEKSVEYAIEVSHISKSYRMFQKPVDRLKQTFSSKKFYKDFWALKDISFRVPKGGTVGIVGRNGSGKSTLLQILAGTLAPTSGSVKINGKIAALLELGSGFNPEFTGRENVYLSGSIYGISRTEMDNRFSRIEQFADIGSFIDQPVKTYSSGMFARLAFAVNINVDADILIVDEVLSVGDHFFQAKCMSAINELMAQGTTILLVSHSQATVKALCKSAILFNKGELVLFGDCDSVMDRYMAISLSEELEYQQSSVFYNEKQKKRNRPDTENEIVYRSLVQPPFYKRITERFGNARAEFTEAALFQDGKETVVVKTLHDCRISLWLTANENILSSSEIGVVIRTFEGVDLFALNSFFANDNIPPIRKGEHIRIDFCFFLALGPGKYSVTLGMRSPVQGEYVDKVFNAIIFDVVNITSHTVPLLFDVPFKMEVFADESKN